MQADATALEQPDALSERLKCAIVVRHGEMKILKKLISELDAKLPAPQPSSEGMLVDEEPARKQKTMSKKEMREEKKRQREENKESSSIRTKKSRRT